MSRKRHPVWRTLWVMAVDLVAIGLGLGAAYWLRFHSPLTRLVPVVKGYDPRDYLHMLPIAWGVWFIALRVENLYRRRFQILDFNVARRIVTGSCLAVLVLIAINFFQQIGVYSRLMTLLMLVTVDVSLLTGRLALNRIHEWLVMHYGVGLSRVAILGHGDLARRIAERLRRHPEHGMKPVGAILPEARDEAAESFLREGGGLSVLGVADHLEELLVEHKVDEVIVIQPDVDDRRIQRLLIECERAMADFRIVPSTTELLLSGMNVEVIEGCPMLGIRETPLRGWNAALKRLIDVTAASVGLLLSAPIVLTMAWWVKRHDGGPSFFRQERMGLDGRLFKIIKLRTMRLDAEQHSGPTFATDRDPRCTRLGAFLRRSHLDELPQLVNVLRGDMSLVGPRPERPYFIERFRDEVPRYMVRHKVRSGITGWAQVNGLCGLHGSIGERIQYDLYYIENWSLWLDLKIVIKTVLGRIVHPGAAS